MGQGFLPSHTFSVFISLLVSQAGLHGTSSNVPARRAHQLGVCLGPHAVPHARRPLAQLRAEKELANKVCVSLRHADAAKGVVPLKGLNISIFCGSGGLLTQPQ